MTEIYLAMECVNYEGCRPMKAFYLKEDAEKLVERCRAHQKKKPRFPSNYKDDGVCAAYEAERKKWLSDHPYPKAEIANAFHVEALELA